MEQQFRPTSYPADWLATPRHEVGRIPRARWPRRRFHRSIVDGEITVEDTDDDWVRIVEVLKVYTDLALDAVDASVRATASADEGPEGIDVVLGDPGLDLVEIEAQQVSPLDVGDPSLLDESADVADAHAEEFGHFGDRQQRPTTGADRLGGCGRHGGCFLAVGRVPKHAVAGWPDPGLTLRTRRSGPPSAATSPIAPVTFTRPLSAAKPHTRFVPVR